MKTGTNAMGDPRLLPSKHLGGEWGYNGYPKGPEVSADGVADWISIARYMERRSPAETRNNIPPVKRRRRLRRRGLKGVKGLSGGSGGPYSCT